MRDFVTAFAPIWGSSSSEGVELIPLWDALIETSYLIVGDAHCESTGLVTNWIVPAQSSLASAGTAGCSGSGTPPAEFGSEASRYAWRMALAWLWYADGRAASLLRPLVDHASAALASYGDGCLSESTCAALRLTPACLVTSIHSNWLQNAFMLGPIACSFMVPPIADTLRATQQTALDNAASLLGATTISDYYSGSWVSNPLSASQPILPAALALGP